MARPSKTQRFTIYHDTGIPSPDPSHDPSTDYDDVSKDDIEEEGDETLQDASTLEGIEEAVEPSNIDPTDTEREDERRESAVTSASISSMPESSSETEQTHNTPIHTTYSPQMIRPSFRRPESVRRLQMSSPTASVERSPRRSVLHSRSRIGTPRSNKGSPAIKKRYEELLGSEEEKKEYPLVLLHVTLLPVQLRWSKRSLRDLLPEDLLEEYRLLRSKVSETVAQRGILILHPKDDYELLEERLLEALELKEERITKCGHFRAQGSISSISSSEESTDSAMGSSIASSNPDVCSTCHHQIKGADSRHAQKWSIKVYAANGLIRASAWSAAWSEMERVDVEILPWINNDLRRTLDARLHEELEDQQNSEDEEVGLHNEVRQRASAMPQGDTLGDAEAKKFHCEDAEETVFEPKSQALDDLPPIYPRKDIPLSVLLRNYLYLLAQDKRNIAICGLAVLTLWMSLRTALTSPVGEGPVLPTIYKHSHQRTLTSDMPTVAISSSNSLAAESSLRPIVFEPSEVVATTAEGIMMPTATAAHNLQDEKETPDEVEMATMQEVLPVSPAPVLQDEVDAYGTCGNPASPGVLFG